MPRKLSRRALMSSAAAAPAVLTRGGAKPVVVASANGNKLKNGGPRTAVAEAFERLTRGADVVDAVIAGVNLVELDPADDSVGYGGLPNADGVVQLDAACMHGTKKRAGGVAALEGVRTPSLVARAVMEDTDHHLLVGQGAQAFARAMGFTIEPDLNTEHSRQLWLEWKRRMDPQHYLDPKKRADAGARARREMIAAGLLDPQRIWGTIHCSALDPRGQMGSVTTTSGLAWKIPGRVGDSPILGAGLWVDSEVGAAGSTGRGEANLYGLSSFFIVEQLRLGKHPKDAALEALRRITGNTVEKRLLGAGGRPKFQVSFYVLDRRGQVAGVSLYASVGGKPVSFSLCTEHGPETRPCDGLLGDMPAD
jgi:N4-(beta-N-acetylglucosaminyl)-L-asparaginase